MVQSKLRNAAVVLALGLCASQVFPHRLDAQSAVDLFSAQSLQRLDIDLHTADWARLKQDFLGNDYYPADITWNGIKAYNTGIRSRGVASRSGNKPGLRLDFDHYASHQTYLGLKSLVLDNLLQDPSGVHETVAMWFFARLGVPAPRETHAMVYVNGNYAGLYALVEPVDKVLLARVFGGADGEQNDGYLYEFNKAGEWWLSYLGPNLEGYKPFFGPKTHEARDDETLYRPLENLVRLINEKPAEELSAAVGPYLDLAAVVRYLAVQNFIGEIDGLAGQWGINNFYLYRLQHTEQHVLIAWDEDLAFLDPSYDLMSNHDANVLVRKVISIPEYRALYLATLADAARSAGEGADGEHPGAMERETRREFEVIDQAMLADTQRPWTDTEYVDAREYMKLFAPRRVRYVECELARLTGARPCS